VPTRAEQGFLAGFIVMADWIASNEEYFTGIDDPGRVSLAQGRARANVAWTALGLRGGWGSRPVSTGDLIREMFGKTARAAQQIVMAAAHRMQSPGIMVVEAPMGEGKTEAALVAAYIIAAKFGCDGIFVGMPTQATSDPMYTRTSAWVKKFAPDVPIALLHGKSMFNKEYRAAKQNMDSATYSSICEDDNDFDDDDDEYGMGSGEGHAKRGPLEWFSGRHRGLLCPVCIGTIDQLLMTATRSKHVMLRFSGLAGKVVILDEVHAADIYMTQFLIESLRWLGQAGVPVILLSATLPPATRKELVDAYVWGAKKTVDLPQPTGYPSVTAATIDGECCTQSSLPWRDSLPVRVSTVDDGKLIEEVERRLENGGYALIIRNTVKRAQDTFESLRESLAENVVLLHGRFTVAQRADLTAMLLDRLGPTDERSGKFVLVATQIAEQSFDVDADVLFTDLAPMDLLLQRIGRLHRHDREHRAISAPEVVITGYTLNENAVPTLEPAAKAIYGAHVLWRTAALIERARGRTWSIPSDVPSLVETAYQKIADIPDSWRLEHDRALELRNKEDLLRIGKTKSMLLSQERRAGEKTLAGLHRRSDLKTATEDAVHAAVRDGKESVEVIMVRHRDGNFFTLGGRNLGPTGEVATNDDVKEFVLGGTVRLPADDELAKSAKTELWPLPGWTSDPWLGHSRALIFEEETVQLGNYTFAYDNRLGLISDKQRHHQ
jgi:CRISPR-associated endonuclease/helicase Cas3